MIAKIKRSLSRLDPDAFIGLRLIKSDTGDKDTITLERLKAALPKYVEWRVYHDGDMLQEDMRPHRMNVLLDATECIIRLHNS